MSLASRDRDVHDPELDRRRCVANAKTTGNRCKRRPIPGGRVCKIHGGAAPQVQKSARLRLAELVDPAIVNLARVLADPKADHGAKIRAAEAVLDRSGYPRRSEVDVTSARERLEERIRRMQQEQQ